MVHGYPTVSKFGVCNPPVETLSASRLTVPPDSVCAHAKCGEVLKCVIPVRWNRNWRGSGFDGARVVSLEIGDRGASSVKARQLLGLSVWGDGPRGNCERDRFY
jgi:hypothetical protein